MRTVVECLSCSHKSITNERYYDFNIVKLADKLGVPESQHSTLRSCQFLGAMKHIISKPYIQNAGGSCNDFLEALLPLSSQIQTY